MLTRELWQHRGTHELWAVELRDGIVAAAAGPLSLGDAHHEFLSGLDYATTDAAWIEKDRESFRPYSPVFTVDP
jgi:hypothetical protein